ncbi:hypothetical protein ACVSTU_23515, partial [Yersinia enterocolitica]
RSILLYRSALSILRLLAKRKARDITLRALALYVYSRVPFGRNPKQPNSGGLLPRCGFSQCLLFTL